MKWNPFLHPRKVQTLPASRVSQWNIIMPVSYTHLDVYKRQGTYGYSNTYKPLSGPYFKSIHVQWEIKEHPASKPMSMLLNFPSARLWSTLSVLRVKRFVNCDILSDARTEILIDLCYLDCYLCGQVFAIRLRVGLKIVCGRCRGTGSCVPPVFAVSGWSPMTAWCLLVARGSGSRCLCVWWVPPFLFI